MDLSDKDFECNYHSHEDKRQDRIFVVHWK